MLFVMCLSHYLQGTDVEQQLRCTSFCMCKQVGLHFCLGLQSLSFCNINLLFNILEDNPCCICLVVLLGTLKSRKAFFLQHSQSIAGADCRIFWRIFGSSCSSGLLSVAHYALQSVPQPLFHTFTWMKMPKLVCVQLFNKWRLEPLRQKEKKCQYTHQHCISLTRKKRNCQLAEIPACPCRC